MPLRTLSGRHTDPRKGRGAAINPEGRFEKVEREAYDDDWMRDGDEASSTLTIMVVVTTPEDERNFGMEGGR